MKTDKKLFLSQVNGNIPRDKPMVFWDTCALLDILRIPVRKELSINDLTCYENIADCIERERIVSVTSGLVLKELLDHYENERRNLLRKQDGLKRDVTNYASYMESESKKRRITSAIELLNAEPRLVRLLNRIMKHTFIIREADTYRGFADYRVRNGLAPGRRSEYKDCYIWGTFLKLVHKLNPASSYIAFMTTNKRDYPENDPQLTRDCYLRSMCITLHIGQLKGGIDGALNANQQNP